ncbi:MAG: DUF2290 domain-containing protein [Mesorhizobium sp.]|uniref:DUF2290 domain-containing protein n=1 Tax=Mesorhizobium sp. TaxID=1871066 RepID=UPI000FEA1C6D|nr:DUF2290 domain-containing protein [Mesorhizobium sp.]RWL82230.1 MAG: DUF2290 domain-containing protein [Mesorhizobium sp.]RWL87364.1 MAG: DUF2290 domain-containing protein [Mesorhizobium sp.]RWL98705.1 MAG: DUF2290 domain-containing protein [Mesorhizobium sp.]
MPSPDLVRQQIESLTADLIEVGLSSRQNFPIRRNHPGGKAEITTDKFQDMSILLKDISYGDLYMELVENEIYNIIMIDGAIIQLQYLYVGDVLEKHRLAFLPSPNLDEFQNNAEIYEADEIYADVISRNIYPSPIRFDFDRSAAIDITHPMSHLTIGQYTNCRIPVTAPLSPFLFIQFILRSFYNTGYRKCEKQIKTFTQRFQATITQNEVGLMHVGVP